MDEERSRSGKRSVDEDSDFRSASTLTDLIDHLRRDAFTRKLAQRRVDRAPAIRRELDSKGD